MRKTVSKFLSLSLIYLMLLSVIGSCLCAAAAETAYPITVTDQSGREVTIEKEPERIVSGYYIPSSLLIALGLKDKIVGIEAKADKRPVYSLAAPQLTELPSVGSAKDFDLETCASLSPDLVILPLKLKDAAQSLTELQIPVLLVNPESQELLETMIGLISTATDTEEPAAELLAYIDEQTAMLSDALADVETPEVYLAGNSSLLSTAGEAMYQSSLIELAGGKNAASEISDTYWADISYEQLLAWDPDVIVVNGEPKADKSGSSAAEDILSNPDYASLKAVQDQKVYGTPNAPFSWVDRPAGPNRLIGMRWFSALIYPEYIKCDINEEIHKFFDLFYHVDLSDEQLENVLKGTL